MEPLANCYSKFRLMLQATLKAVSLKSVTTSTNGCSKRQPQTPLQLRPGERLRQMWLGTITNSSLTRVHNGFLLKEPLFAILDNRVLTASPSDAAYRSVYSVR